MDLKTPDWCDCADAPLFTNGPATLLDHPGACEFPGAVCTVRAHRAIAHDRCGRELLVRFCGCGGTGFTHDVDRDWWVCYRCGWPTRAWYEGSGKPAPEQLAGMRPVTYHEFVAVPRSPQSAYARLDERQRELNKAFANSWVRD